MNGCYFRSFINIACDPTRRRITTSFEYWNVKRCSRLTRAYQIEAPGSFLACKDGWRGLVNKKASALSMAP